ncbi:cupin [Legionella brunensis]|uniref:Putative Cupin region protein n=1 Tax=Legionella brunensis TaxID=29422 RepID=A0A0W0SNX9_9GAMM|nr:cupin [Legionella brunensis]KTC84945.1 putative Cupin region protein [Legionella brunensis]
MNNATPQKLIPLVQELRALKILEHDDTSNIARVSAILSSWVSRDDWLEEHYFEVDTVQGFTSWLLHEEPDHSLAINLLTWEPKREITPHDHNTWGVVGCIRGIEENYFWTRLDDGSKPGYAKIKRENNFLRCFPGDIIRLAADDIHSVINISDSVGISLHVYGKNLNYTNRSKYDPINNKFEPFIIDFS